VSITNLTVAEAKEVVFASSASYTAALPMAGRDAQKQILFDVIARREPHIVSISAPLGAGKTFFLSHVLGELTKARDVAFDEQNDAVTMMANKHFSGSEVGSVDPAELATRVLAQRFGDRAAGISVLIVEELDRKSDWEPLFAAVRACVAWAKQGHGVLVLTGDRLLSNPDIQAELDLSGVPRSEIDLEPLSRELLGEAILLRLAQHLKKRAIDEEIAKAVEGLFYERGIRDGIFPSLGVPVATFRQALETLRAMSGYLPLDKQPCRLPVHALAPWRTTVTRPSGLALELEKVLFNEVKERYLAQESWRSVEVGDLQALIKDREGDSDEYEDFDYYFDEAIRPLVRSDSLIPMGIPYAGGTGELHRLPGPYVPGGTLFLRVMAFLYLDSAGLVSVEGA
jgi:hypothetical protein